jgi:hypothetical protein
MIIKKGTNTKIAVLEDEEYNSNLEHHLTTEGFFAAALKNPKQLDIHAHPDFFLAPEWIRWLMPTPATAESWIADLGSSHDRNKLRKKLQASHMQRSDIRVERAPLTVDDYDIWYRRLYLPEIGGRPGAILFWPKTAALAKKVTVTESGVVPDFFRIFMYHKDGSFIGGALWSISKSENSLTTRASAFEKNARGKYELSTWALEESRVFASSQSLKWLSYGTDPNLFGVDVGLGLPMFKAKNGMKPVLARVGAIRLIKILNRDLSQLHTIDGTKPSVLMFSMGGSDLSDKIMACQNLPHRKNRGNLDLLWDLDIRLTPVHFVTDRQTPTLNVPKRMILENIVL